MKISDFKNNILLLYYSYWLQWIYFVLLLYDNVLNLDILWNLHNLQELGTFHIHIWSLFHYFRPPPKYTIIWLQLTTTGCSSIIGTFLLIWEKNTWVVMFILFTIRSSAPFLQRITRGPLKRYVCMYTFDVYLYILLYFVHSFFWAFSDVIWPPLFQMITWNCSLRGTLQ